jgi:hypothetical protein
MNGNHQMKMGAHQAVMMQAVISLGFRRREEILEELEILIIAIDETLFKGA